MSSITLNVMGKTGVFPEGITVRDVLSQLEITMNPQVLAAECGGSVMELTCPVTTSGTLTPLTLGDDEGRRIYERSLRFVMLASLRRLYPSKQVRIEHSIGHGVFVRLPGVKLTRENVAAVSREMDTICREDMIFRKEVWDKDAAIEYFVRDGQKDKVQLLERRQNPQFTMYFLDGMWEYFYGAMVPSTSMVRVFSLEMYEGGFVLMMPTAETPEHPALYVERPRHNAAFALSEKWCRILHVTNVADLDSMIEKGEMRNFIRVNEALQDGAIGEIARKIAEGGKRIALIAGPSSSGKTTFAARLAVHLQVLGLHPVTLSMDNYYLDRDVLPKEEDGSVDLEAVSTLDLPLLRSQLSLLLQGEEVEAPVYNFNTKKREKKGIPTILSAGDVLIMEGIHGLNPLLTEGILPGDAGKIHRIFVSALTCINLDDHNRIRTTDVRLMRRIVRDNQFRATPCSETLGMWQSVRRGEERWIFPWQEMADSVFNSTLHYELPVLRLFLMKLIRQIPPESPEYLLASRLRKTLNYVLDMPEEIMREIPPTSLMREFIGGSTFDI